MTHLCHSWLRIVAAQIDRKSSLAAIRRPVVKCPTCLLTVIPQLLIVLTIRYLLLSWRVSQRLAPSVVEAVASPFFGRAAGLDRIYSLPLNCP